ncbi:transposase [Bradyrhizobium sp. BRP14]|nr:transposase [Bradyrhizobium sp. BRP14]
MAEALEPGASVSAIAHRIGIRPLQLFAWRRDALDHASLQRSASEVPAARAAGAAIEIVIGDVVVRRRRWASRNRRLNAKKAFADRKAAVAQAAKQPGCPRPANDRRVDGDLLNDTAGSTTRDDSIFYDHGSYSLGAQSAMAGTKQWR